MLLYSNSTFIVVRCCAHAVDKDSYERDKDTTRDTSKFKCRSARSARSNCFACSAVSDKRDAYCRSRTLKIFVTFCDKDSQHIPSSIAWAQHLKSMNVALEHNSICIINSTECFRRDLAHFQTYSVHFQQKSVTLVLGNDRAMYSWDSTP